jgi:hypothetical protein
LKCLSESERKILFTGDPDQEFDPFTYIWILMYPKVRIQILTIEQNFQHILQFKEILDVEENLMLNQQDQPRSRGRPQSIKKIQKDR